MSDFAFMNEEKTVILFTDGGQSVVIEPGHDLWEKALAADPAPYQPPPAPDPLEIERAGMVVSRLQARGALLQAGLLETVEKAVNGGFISGSQVPPMVKLAWNEAGEFRRASPTIAAVGALLGMGEEQLDDLFRAARLIEF